MRGLVAAGRSSAQAARPAARAAGRSPSCSARVRQRGQRRGPAVARARPGPAHPLVVQPGQQLVETLARAPGRRRRVDLGASASASRGPGRRQWRRPCSPHAARTPRARCAGWPARSPAARPATAGGDHRAGVAARGAAPASRSGRAPARWSGAPGAPRPARAAIGPQSRKRSTALSVVRAASPVDAALTLARRAPSSLDLDGPASTPTRRRTHHDHHHRSAREVDPDRLDAFIGRVIGDVGATVSAGARRPRRPARPLPRDGRRRARRRPRSSPSAPAPASRTSRRGWPTRPPAATSSTTPRPTTWSMTPGAGLRARRSPTARRSSPAACSSPSACCATCPRSRTGSAPAPASAGTSTTPTCSRAPSGSSGPATSPTWSSPGCPRSTAWCAELERWRPRRRRRAAVTGRRRS